MYFLQAILGMFNVHRERACSVAKLERRAELRHLIDVLKTKIMNYLQEIKEEHDPDKKHRLYVRLESAWNLRHVYIQEYKKLLPEGQRTPKFEGKKHVFRN